MDSRNIKLQTSTKKITKTYSSLTSIILHQFYLPFSQISSSRRLAIKNQIVRIVKYIKRKKRINTNKIANCEKKEFQQSEETHSLQLPFESRYRRNTPVNRTLPEHGVETWSADFPILATPPNSSRENTAVIFLVTLAEHANFRPWPGIPQSRENRGHQTDEQETEGAEVEDGIGIANIPPPTFLSVPSIFPRPSFPRPLHPYTRRDIDAFAAISLKKESFVVMLNLDGIDSCNCSMREIIKLRWNEILWKEFGISISAGASFVSAISCTIIYLYACIWEIESLGGKYRTSSLKDIRGKFVRKWSTRSAPSIEFFSSNKMKRIECKQGSKISISYDIVEVFESAGRKQIILTSIENFILSLDRF